MKVKNLIIGNIYKIEYERIPMEDYYPSSADIVGNLPNYEDNSLFYKIGNHAFDLIGLGFYKIVKNQEKYPDKMRNKKVVTFEESFSNLTNEETISRDDAILVYRLKK